mmetsp:Transcript_30390/g.83488  ORF Transcript_30390/g.83488 Transcript_30390/m.83488 type:complete len:209 (-) Transcript_30390:41-667(-)
MSASVALFSWKYSGMSVAMDSASAASLQRKSRCRCSSALDAAAARRTATEGRVRLKMMQRSNGRRPHCSNIESLSMARNWWSTSTARTPRLQDAHPAMTIVTVGLKRVQRTVDSSSANSLQRMYSLLRDSASLNAVVGSSTAPVSAAYCRDNCGGCSLMKTRALWRCCKVSAATTSRELTLYMRSEMSTTHAMSRDTAIHRAKDMGGP